MSKIHDEVLQTNANYRANFGEKGKLALPPVRRFAILTCMDARLDPAKFAGLVEGDAHVIRNAGGRCLYVMMAMGLFEMDGGASVNPFYEIGSPLFDRATIHLNAKYYRGKDFTVEAHNNSPSNIYVQSARLNGTPLNRAWILHSEIIAGGKLEFEMGPQPNKQWATRPEDAPPLRP